MAEWKDNFEVSEVLTAVDFNTRMNDLADRIAGVTVKSQCHVSVCDAEAVDGQGDCELTGTVIGVHIDHHTTLFTPDEASDVAGGIGAAIQHGCGKCLSCQLMAYVVDALTDAVHAVHAASFTKH